MTLPGLRSDRARALLPLAALLVGALSAVASASYLRRVQNADTRDRFAHRSHEASHAIAHGLDGSGDSLRGVRGLFDSSVEVTADETEARTPTTSAARGSSTRARSVRWPEVIVLRGGRGRGERLKRYVRDG